MRVSKLVKDSIQSKVQAKAEAKLTQLKDLEKQQRDEDMDKVKALDATLENIIVTSIEPVIQSFIDCNPDIVFNSYWCTDLSANSMAHNCFKELFHSYHLKATKADAYADAYADLKKKVAEATNDIILALELGGSKKDLLDLLNNTNF